MPYKSTAEIKVPGVKDLPKHQQKAFMEAFNSAHASGKYDETTCIKIAWSAAKKAAKNESITESLNEKKQKWAIWNTIHKDGMLAKGDKILYGPFDNEAEVEAKRKELCKGKPESWSGKYYISPWSRLKESNIAKALTALTEDSKADMKKLDATCKKCGNVMFKNGALLGAYDRKDFQRFSKI